jgi:hypothetical protein
MAYLKNLLKVFKTFLSRFIADLIQHTLLLKFMSVKISDYRDFNSCGLVGKLREDPQAKGV